MSEARTASSVSQIGRPGPAPGRRNRLNPLEALERGFALFRSTFAEEAWRYYVGAAPLVLCFIPMWVANGQIRLSDGALLMEAAILTGAYLLRVWTVAGYMQGVRERGFGVPRTRLTSPSARVAAVGRLLAWKIMLSAAALATLTTIAGASWFYSACQYASLEAREDAAESHSLNGCLALAGQWFGGAVLLFLMFFPLWIAVWVNGFILAMLLPQLLHSIFGLNTLLSTQMGMYALLESSAFWLSLFAGSWLALDPIVKCTFVAVYQHSRSRLEGDDLLGLLASLPRRQKDKAELVASAGPRGRVMAGSLLVLATILAGAQQTAGAPVEQPSLSHSTQAADDAVRRVRVQRLSQALDEESQRAIYRWHDAEHPSSPTWFDRLLAKMGNALRRAWDALQDTLRKLWKRGPNLSLGNETRLVWRLKHPQLWLVLLAALTAMAGALLIARRRRRESVGLAIPAATVPLPDLSDAAIASERSEKEWFLLADRLEREGELKLALRSAYLGLLAGLAQREWLTIRRDRTNREYLDEFTRRWRRRPQASIAQRMEIPEKLRGSLRLFDCVWYGSQALTPAVVTAYRRDQQELLNHVS
jgi:hypothetical protein